MKAVQEETLEESNGNGNKKKPKQADVLSKLNDLYKESAEANSRFNPEKYHWSLLRQWREKNVQYHCLRDIQGYVFRAVDEEGYYKELVLNCQKFFNKKIDDNPNKRNPGVDLNLLAHYE